MSLEQYIYDQLKQKPICLMTHVIAGYPSFKDNYRALEIMAQSGVDMVEIQMPFSEPIADGPVFVQANQQALKNGTTVERYFEFMTQCAGSFDFPFLMMGYYNTVYKLGEGKFIELLAASGGKGFILPDLPIEEGESLYQAAKDQGLAPIAMMTPTSTPERLRQVGQAGAGFVYAVARKGVTGKHTEFDQDFRAYVHRCRVSTRLPLAMGFGIAERKDLELLTGQVEMAILGTVLLKTWELAGASGLSDFFRKLLE